MRKWLAGKLFDMAVWLDWGTAAEAARVVTLIDIKFEKALVAPKKRGRPKGSKDGVGPKPKRGRPLGSKNKPKETLQ